MTLRDFLCLPDRVIRAAPLEVDHKLIVLVIQPHSIHEALLFPYLDTDFANPLALINVDRLHSPLAMVCSASLLSCNHRFFLEDLSLNAVRKLELNALQHIVVPPVDALHLDRLAKIHDLSQVSCRWELKTDTSHFCSKHIHPDQIGKIILLALCEFVVEHVSTRLLCH